MSGTLQLSLNMLSQFFDKNNTRLQGYTYKLRWFTEFSLYGEVVSFIKVSLILRKVSLHSDFGKANYVLFHIDGYNYNIRM